MIGRKLVLASASPRRFELLTALGMPFDVVPADIDETFEPRSPGAMALDLARRKAEAVRVGRAEAVIIAADTIVAQANRMLGKPADDIEARGMLASLRGRWHEVTTGMAVIDGGAEETLCTAVTTRVLMRKYSDAEVDATIAAGTPFDKAGAYAIQDKEFHPVERYDGCYYNVVGLPLWGLIGLLDSLPSPVFCPRPDAAFSRCSACPDRPGPPAMPLNAG